MTHQNLRHILLEQEDKWISQFYDFIKKKFMEIHLPSHDHLHHYRVWNYAKELMLEIEKTGHEFSKQMVEAILIACFFHDIGMTIDPGSHHGKISSGICKDYFKNFDSKPDLLDDCLLAIELHDDKEYSRNKKMSKTLTFLLSILNVADDLDAFGIIGIYRYAEIYLTRGIPVHEIPGKVIHNSENRFCNILLHFGHLTDFVNKYKKEYLLIKNFYEKAALQQETGEDKNDNIKILEIINEYLVLNKYTLNRLNNEVPHLNFPGEVEVFFKKICSPVIN
ncbi:MAG: HD domain-containing protein [Bacteroidota bacterium]